MKGNKKYKCVENYKEQRLPHTLDFKDRKKEWQKERNRQADKGIVRQINKKDWDREET